MLWFIANLLNKLNNATDKYRLCTANQRPYTMTNKLFGLRRKKMGQAKTLTDQELKRVLNFVASQKHAKRNRAMLLVTHWSGMRVGEVAALKISDVWSAESGVKNEVRLLAEQTKGKHARSVFFPQKLRRELAAYLAAIDHTDISKPLFSTQKRDHFTANTLCQHFHWIYRQAGIAGASSHSGRRTFITALANKGVGVRVLMALAGHRNISTTQAYIDVNDEMKRSAVELI
jgi:integrase/recombinase XerD